MVWAVLNKFGGLPKPGWLYGIIPYGIDGMFSFLLFFLFFLFLCFLAFLLNNGDSTAARFR